MVLQKKTQIKDYNLSRIHIKAAFTTIATSNYIKYMQSIADN